MTARHAALASLLLACLATAQAAPADPVVARAGAATLTASGLRALVASLPAEARAKAAADPAALAELARSAVVQSLLLTKARAKGWDKRPDVIAAAERARQAEIVRGFVASETPPPPPPTDAQLQPVYDANKPRLMLPRQYHLAQIFLALPAGAGPATAEQKRRQLADLRSQIDGRPEAFAAAARRISEDKRSAANGGDLGWIAEDKLVAPIKAAIAGMQIGGLSEPLRTDDGFHLLALTGTQAAGVAPFAQARPILAHAYAEQQMQAATRAYLDQILQHDPVELDQPALRSLATHGGLQ